MEIHKNSSIKIRDTINKKIRHHCCVDTKRGRYNIMGIANIPQTFRVQQHPSKDGVVVITTLKRKPITEITVDEYREMLDAGDLVMFSSPSNHDPIIERQVSVERLYRHVTL